MNVKEHLSKETLASLLKNELPGETIRTAGLHLSYCPVCRGQKDELALELEASRMWEAYAQLGAPGEAHVEDSAFRRFWLGELRDEEVIEQLSRHCVVCRDCRKRREMARAEVQRGRARARVWVFSALAFIAGWFVWRRRYHVLGAAAVLFLVIATPLFLLNLRTVNQPPNEANINMAVAVPTQPGRNDNSRQITLSPEPPVNGSPEIKKLQRRDTPPRPEAGHELLARAQMIDLNRVPEDAPPRSSDDPNGGAESHFKIVASRSGTTRLRIGLPKNSKRGAYYVSILDPAFLDELVLAKGSSRDGLSLPVVINMQNLKEGEYILHIERRPPNAGKEYVGDYRVLVTKPSPPDDRPAGETRPSGADKHGRLPRRRVAFQI
jgi:hypothetical protein